MSTNTQRRPALLRVDPFKPHHAPQIAAWVRTDEDLLRLAPGTRPPLTSQKVIAWNKPTGSAWVLTREGESQPIGYGELTPAGTSAPASRSAGDSVWIGHLIVVPHSRGQGAGRMFTEALVRHAFDQLSAKRVVLVVFPGNTAAIRCYRAVGFTVVSDEHRRFRETGPKHRLLRLEIQRPTLNHVPRRRRVASPCWATERYRVTSTMELSSP